MFLPFLVFSPTNDNTINIRLLKKKLHIFVGDACHSIAWRSFTPTKAEK